MKFGSVQFFKRLIVAGLAVILALPLVLAVVFGVLYANLRGEVQQLEAVNWALAHGTALPGAVTPPGDALPDPGPAIESETGQAQYGAGTQPSFEYQVLFPELYVQRPETVATTEKVCYLSFDDGPSSNTRRILETLDKYDIKATFFVTGEAGERHSDILREAAGAGHTVAVHTYSHEYDTIYASVEAYLEDFDRMRGVIAEATGAEPGIFRFPGGSINVYNQQLYTQLIAEMTRRGYVFFDWNVAASDAVAGGIGQGQVVANVLEGAAGRQRALVLMHDRLDNTTTADALPAIIEGLMQQGFTFAPLTAQVQPITFFYQNQ